MIPRNKLFKLNTTAMQSQKMVFWGYDVI
jgi:hypothetical protein